MSWVGLVTFGFLLGVRHAVEADHLAAVASLSTRSTSLTEAVRLGAVWGVGHTLMLFVVGSIVLFWDAVVPERMAWGLELAVGFMLVGLGVDVLRRLVRDRIHFHLHEHTDGTMHFHAHSHAGERHENDHELEHDHAHPRSFPGRALAVGLMHGMAGSAALVVLALAQAPTVASGILYIAVFGAGSILGMALLSIVISMPLRYSEQATSTAMTSLRAGLQGLIGIVTIAIGSLLIVELVGVYV